jgi:HD-GYP domain-containing protein (c-di-GMP phosphodiesterase class II)
VLDKNGPLDAAEREAVQQHPIFTWEILKRISAFADFARSAASHHEKLDGSGYPWRVGGDDIDPSARILVVADIFEALTATRPYRSGMTPEHALSIMAKDRGTRLDAQALDALATLMLEKRGQTPSWPDRAPTL